MISIRIAALMVAVALVLPAGCGGTKPIPKLPALMATTDKEVRSSIMYTYGVVGAMGNALDRASALEATIARSGGIPPDADRAIRAQFVKVATAGKKLLADIDSKALTDWKQIQARVNPIIDEINTLANLSRPTGPSGWATFVQVAIDIAIGILQPGALIGGRDLPESAPATFDDAAAGFVHILALNGVTQ